MASDVAGWIKKVKILYSISLIVAIIGFIIAISIRLGYLRVSYGIIYGLVIISTIWGLIRTHSVSSESFKKELLYPAQHTSFMNFAFALSLLLLIQSPLYRYESFFAVSNLIWALILAGIALFVLIENKVKYGIPIAP